MTEVLDAAIAAPRGRRTVRGMIATKNTHLVTLAQAAEALQVSKRTVLRPVEAGIYPAYKLGTSWRFDLNELLAASRYRP